MMQEDIVRRLRRIEGQVVGIRRMVEEGRYCIEVLDQLSAARAGLESAGLRILEDHVSSCVREALHAGDAVPKTEELMTAVRRFVRSG